jgi:hypothetical protein
LVPGSPFSPFILVITQFPTYTPLATLRSARHTIVLFAGILEGSYQAGFSEEWSLKGVSPEGALGASEPLALLASVNSISRFAVSDSF